MLTRDACLLALVTSHLLLVVWDCNTTQPTLNEPAHFVAGASVGILRDVSMDAVNPSLVRAWTVMPFWRIATPPRQTHLPPRPGKPP